MVLPTYCINENTPAVPAGESGGVAVFCPSPVRLSKGVPFALHGVFAVPKNEALEFPEHLLRAVVVLLRGPSPVTRSVGDGQLLFDDDLIEDGNLVRGYFNLDLFSFFGLAREPGRFWVCASIFRHISNVVTVESVR